MVSSGSIVFGDILKNYLIVLMIVEFLQVSKKAVTYELRKTSYVKCTSPNKTTKNVSLRTIDKLIYQGGVNRDFCYDN